MIIQTTPQIGQSFYSKFVYFSFTFTKNIVIVYPTTIFYDTDNKIEEISFILHNKHPDEIFLMELSWDYDISIEACRALFKSGNDIIDNNKHYISTITIQY